MKKQMPSIWEDITVADVVSNIFVEAATLVGVFFLGAMIGSFVSVVLYRMPRRMNIFWPPSHCPACGKSLKLIDNVPILGRQRLGGRCRFCAAPIPHDYLRLEIGFGLLLLAVMYVELHSGGWNLPIRHPNTYPGALWNLWYPKPELIGLVAFHELTAVCVAMLFLFTRRGDSLPGLLVLYIAGAGLFLSWWFSDLHLIPWSGVPGEAAARRPPTGVLEAILGGGVGGLLGLGMVSRPTPAGDATNRPLLPIPMRLSPAVLLMILGIYLGWQAALSIALLTGLLVLLQSAEPLTKLLVIAAALHFAGWRALDSLSPWWPGSKTSFELLPVWGGAACLTVSLFSRPGPTVTDGSAMRSAEPSPSSAPPTPPEVPTTDSPAHASSTNDSSASSLSNG